jgi:predicted  nucleic acid-binding Zn-ribbon protein
MSALTRVQTPEERELARKQADIDGLSIQLADRQLELETLRTKLTAFQIRYT